MPAVIIGRTCLPTKDTRAPTEGVLPSSRKHKRARSRTESAGPGRMRKFAVSAPATGDMYLEKQGARKQSEDPDSSLIPEPKQVPRLEIQVGQRRQGARTARRATSRGFARRATWEYAEAARESPSKIHMRRAWTRQEQEQVHGAQDSLYHLNRAKQQCARPARHAVRVAGPARARDAAASSRQPESEQGRRADWKCLPAGPHTDAVHARGRAVLQRVRKSWTSTLQVTGNPFEPRK